MKKVVSDVIQFRGSHYDFGLYQGEQLIDSPILDARKELWSRSAHRHLIVDVEKVKSIIQHFSPGIWEEITGLADALKMDEETALRNFGGYYFEYGQSGCSILMGNSFMIRNYDSDPITYEGRYVVYAPSDSGYATIGPSMQITGRTDGMNEKGLAMGYNFINRLRSNDGFVCNMIGRLVLENCATVVEAVSLLKELPHRISFSYCLVDATGKQLVVEASASEVVTRSGTICTNHFQSLTKENRNRMDDSLNRYEAIDRKQSSIQTPYDAFQLLNDPEHEVFSHKYGAWAGTIHTAAYLPSKQQAWIAFGGNRLPLILDFDKWRNGQDFPVKLIKGELEATNGFINR